MIPVLVANIMTLVIIISMAVHNGRLYRKLHRQSRHLTTACGLLWALADRTEPKVLYVPKERLKPATGGPAVTVEESDNGWTITAGTHHKEES